MGTELTLQCEDVEINFESLSFKSSWKEKVPVKKIIYRDKSFVEPEYRSIQKEELLVVGRLNSTQLSDLKTLEKKQSLKYLYYPVGDTVTRSKVGYIDKLDIRWNPISITEPWEVTFYFIITRSSTGDFDADDYDSNDFFTG